MIDSRLYYDVKELIRGALNFSYYTAEIDIDTSNLKSFTKTINQQDVLLTLDNIGIKNLLFNINEAEYARFLKEIKEYKDYIEELSRTEPFAANNAIAKLWGPNELQRKFTEWFANNGYDIPKVIIRNIDKSVQGHLTTTPNYRFSKLRFSKIVEKMVFNPMSKIRYYLTLLNII